MKNFRAHVDESLKLSQNEKLPQVKLSPVEVLLCYGGRRCLYGCLGWVLSLPVALYGVNCAIYAIQGLGSRYDMAFYVG